MTKSKHTPTPTPWKVEEWEIGEQKDRRVVIVSPTDCVAYLQRLWSPISAPDRESEMEANADLIVLAVNHHAALVSAAERLLDRIDHMTSEQFSQGGEKAEREELRSVLAAIKHAASAEISAT